MVAPVARAALVVAPAVPECAVVAPVVVLPVAPLIKVE